jgi:hypothetical protein
LQIRGAFCISSTGSSDWPTVEHTCQHDKPELEELLFPSSPSTTRNLTHASSQRLSSRSRLRDRVHLSSRVLSI